MAATNELRTRLHRRAYEVLRDGEWHDLESLFADLARLVPPGIATRRYERDLMSSRRLAGIDPNRPRHRHYTREQTIAMGRRTIVRETLADRHGSPTYEVSEGKIRLLREPNVIRGDQRRAEVVVPILDALMSTYAAAGMRWPAEQVRLTAHEYGMHLSSCPEDCELIPLNSETEINSTD